MPAVMFLYTWNGFEIDPSQDNNHIRQKIIGDFNQASNDSLMCWQFSNVSFTPLYKGVNTCKLDMQTHTKSRLIQQFTKCQTLLCSASKVTYNFLSKFISQKFQSLKSLYLICIVNTTDCISSVQTQTNFFVILFDQKSLAVVLEHLMSLDCVQEHRKSLAIVLE